MKQLLLGVLISLPALWLSGCATTDLEPPAVAVNHHYHHGHTSDTFLKKDTITLISLNLAHGRKDNFSQIFTSDKNIRRNLLDIAWYFKERQPDIVSVQEADGPSRWSGDFDHVAFLAEHGELPFYARTEHINTFYGNYGTGILSRLPLSESAGYNFDRTPPSTRKGFTLSTINWVLADAQTPLQVDVLSLHLDFLNPRARHRQVHDVMHVISQRDNPLIVMGDFNSRKIVTEYIAGSLANNVELRSFPLEEEALGTYGNEHLDWVLLSPELEFVSYKIDDVLLSDHRPVLLQVRYRPRS